MTDAAQPGRTGIAGVAERLISFWALLGGALLLAIVLINVVSVIGGIGATMREELALPGWVAPFPGDFELTEIGVAIAAFTFLPYCQLTGANVTADIFTTRAPERLLALFALLAAAVALGFAILLLWRMSAGMISQREYGYTSAILSFPIWTGFVPILISLGLLIVAAAISLLESLPGIGR